MRDDQEVFEQDRLAEDKEGETGMSIHPDEPHELIGYGPDCCGEDDSAFSSRPARFDLAMERLEAEVAEHESLEGSRDADGRPTIALPISEPSPHPDVSRLREASERVREALESPAQGDIGALRSYLLGQVDQAEEGRLLDRDRVLALVKETAGRGLDFREQLDLHERGGDTFAYYAGQYVFRVTAGPQETITDLLRMAYNSGRHNLERALTSALGGTQVASSGLPPEHEPAADRRERQSVRFEDRHGRVEGVDR